MTENLFSNLEPLGFSEFFKAQLADFDPAQNALGRIVFQHSGFFDVMLSLDEVRPAFLSGRIKHLTRARSKMPAAGDWVIMGKDKGDQLPILSILQRSSELKRKVPDRTPSQILAANIDFVFIVHSADASFSMNRLEKHCYVAEHSRINYAIILNKTDLCPETAERLKLIKEKFTGKTVIPLDSVNKKGYEELAPLFIPRQTSVFIGPSGAGKSTIINNLCGREVLKTGAIRERDLQGRHTTTTRKIIILPNGHLIMDTPGIKLVFFDETLTDMEKFQIIRETALTCRFTNCKHLTEPDCAVKKAVEAGEIPEDLYLSWMKYSGK